MSFSERAMDILRDATSLEINTIVAETITGRKMPTPPHALVEIARAFRDKLECLGVKPPQEWEGLNFGSFDSFDALRDAANTEIKGMFRDSAGECRQLDADEQARGAMLCRIRDMSDQAKDIMRAAERKNPETWRNNYPREQIVKKNIEIELDYEQMIELRKIWEIRTEVIAMQTVIQLDGDVVTRVLPEYAREGWEALRAMHYKGVRTATSFWRGLVDLVAAFFPKWSL